MSKITYGILELTKINTIHSFVNCTDHKQIYIQFIIKQRGTWGINLLHISRRMFLIFILKILVCMDQLKPIWLHKSYWFSVSNILIRTMQTNSRSKRIQITVWLVWCYNSVSLLLILRADHLHSWWVTSVSWGLSVVID